tara:strand:+ start:142 stop:720 length:579 start_codon:yes stop_codon:yes gene_type:complete
MSYNIKDVFYLSTSATVTKATAGVGSAQLDLSAYIDPIARGRTRGTGLAIYKVHYSVLNNDVASIAAPDDGESGILTMGLLAGAGLGDNATNAISLGVDSNASWGATNALNVSSAFYYGPTSYPGAEGKIVQYLSPSKDVPYVIVRDNVCLVYNVDTNQKMVDDVAISVRLECAQITLDQATLNQLLRTQTV